LGGGGPTNKSDGSFKEVKDGQKNHKGFSRWEKSRKNLPVRTEYGGDPITVSPHARPEEKPAPKCFFPGEEGGEEKKKEKRGTQTERATTPTIGKLTQGDGFKTPEDLGGKRKGTWERIAWGRNNRRGRLSSLATRNQKKG